MTRQHVLAGAYYGESGREEGSVIELHPGQGKSVSSEGKVIFLAHFEGDTQTKGGYRPAVARVAFAEGARFGASCLRMNEESTLVYRDLPDGYDSRSGTVLMWVAPDTQTVFVKPDQVLFYEEGTDKSGMKLVLSEHHLKAVWNGRGYGDTGDKKSAMDAHEWHLVGMSWGYPKADRVTLFLDGGYWYSSLLTYHPHSDASEIGIGTGTGSGTSFQGQIDEVMITHPALSREEVLALYESGRERSLPFPDQFMAVQIDTSWQNDTLWFEYLPRNSAGIEFSPVCSESIIPAPPHAELFLNNGKLTTTPFDLIGAEITYDCNHPADTRKFPRVRLWECDKCKSPREEDGFPRKRVVESVRNFQVDRVSRPLVRVFWDGGEGAYYRFDKNADNPPDRVGHVKEFCDSLSIDFRNAIMLIAETAQSDETTSDFDTSLIRYMLKSYGPDRPRYYEFINEMTYSEGWGPESDDDSALVWDWRDGYYHTDGRCWTHMVEDTLSWFMDAAKRVDPDLRFGWFIDRRGGWNFDGIPSGKMDEWRQDSILLSNETILKRTDFLAFHDYFPLSMGKGSNSLGEGLWRAVGSLGWKHAYVNPKTWRLFSKYFGHPEWEMLQTEYNTAVSVRSRRMPARAERLFDTWAGAWVNISNFILRYRAGQIDKAEYFKPAYAYGDTPHATINYTRGHAHRTVIEKAFGLYGDLMRDSTIVSDSIWTYGFESKKTSHHWGLTSLPVFDCISTVSPDQDTVAILLVNRDWEHPLRLDLFLDPFLEIDPDHDTALFHHVAFGPTSRGSADEPDTSLLESWGRGYYYPSWTKFDSTDVDFVCDTLPGFSGNTTVDLGRAVFGVLEIPVEKRK